MRELHKENRRRRGARPPVNLRSVPTTVASRKQRYKMVSTFWKKGVGPCLLGGSPPPTSHLRAQGPDSREVLGINNTVNSGLQDEPILRSTTLNLYFIFQQNTPVEVAFQSSFTLVFAPQPLAVPSSLSHRCCGQER